MVNMTEEGLEIIEEFKRLMIRQDQLEFIREEIYSAYYAEYISKLEAGETSEEFKMDENTPEYKGVESIRMFLLRQRIGVMLDMKDYGFKTKEPIKLYRGMKRSKKEPDNDDLISSGFIFLLEDKVIMFACEDTGYLLFNGHIEDDAEFIFLQDLNKDKEEEEGETVFEA